MSIKVSERVWKQSKQEGTRLLVLLALADWCNDKGICYPSDEELAKKCRMKPRNVKYILHDLETSLEVIKLRQAGRGLLSYTVITMGLTAARVYLILRRDLMLDRRVSRHVIETWVNGATERQKVQESEKVQSDVEKVQSSAQKVQRNVKKGAKSRSAYKEEPSGTVKEPSEEPSSGGADAAGALPARNMWVGFSRRYESKYGLAYKKRDGDGAQLNSLRDTYKSKLTDEAWDAACDNYLASPISEHTMRDLCTRFPTFKRSALNEFNKPVVDIGARNGRGIIQTGAASAPDKYESRR